MPGGLQNFGAMKVSSPPRLVSVHDAAQRQEVVFTKHFRHPQCTLSIRPFCVSTDLPVIYNRESTDFQVADLIAASYDFSGESSFARSYMVTLDNNMPLCEVDLCCALQDELCDHYRAIAGDFVMRLLPASPVRPGRRIFTNLLRTCLDFFELLPEVKRVFVESEIENHWQHPLLLNAGFRFRYKVCHEYKTTYLFYFALDKKGSSRFL